LSPHQENRLASESVKRTATKWVWQLAGPFRQTKVEKKQGLVHHVKRKGVNDK